ncbi:MAG: N(4)-(beta-N-acetylglucosaminyl)-L-asparaginase [Gemmatimonadales bacterium]
MPNRVSRRDFVGGAALVVAGSPLAAAKAPWVRPGRASRFAAVGSANGLRGVTRALELIRQGGDTLDAAVEGVKIQELDPEDESVGYGGLPNEAGVVQLDASCVHGPTRRAGGVAALEGIKTPSEVARLVLKYTNHILLVGEGAKRFALSYGFQEEDLLTARSREKWLRWRANRSPSDSWMDVPEGQPVGPRPAGTVTLEVINDKGEISSLTTTSGLAWKIPGRAGDSPIVGAGQYTDNEIGAAGSTGLGELNIMVCGGFLTVEFMRQGRSPTDACLATLRRVVAMCPDAWRDARGRPPQLTFYAINKRGEYGSAAMFPSRYAAGDDAAGARLLDCAFLYERP